MERRALLLDNLDEITLNHYEAVLVAAKKARNINSKRLAQMQLMTQDDEVEIDYRKVTSIAIEHLLSKKIRLRRKG